MNQLIKKFDNFVNVAAGLNDSGIDGLAFWRDYKKDLVKYDDLSKGMSYTIDKAWVNKINYLFQCKHLSNLDINGNTVLPDHFIYQLPNLTMNDQVNIRKVMQLALNIGQWKAAIKNTKGLRFADQIFKECNLESIESYLKKEDIESLSLLLDD
jgi:hypothetical protein